MHCEADSGKLDGSSCGGECLRIGGLHDWSHVANAIPVVRPICQH
ncbi:hypothetical protein I553_7999 [Mycobacterium xenopi 4042]|uniref:Uncharacterized protein n=1 Tax=Mycobacterium xenopi 4042 TaxID=1299334 RepID=X8DAR5_MYCXE|nr:hypothetical protein I553_7999 [Mycobacterium xenopi 4042]